MGLNRERATAVAGGTAETAQTTGVQERAGLRRTWVAVISAAALVVLLCVRNRFLFSTRLYEDADMGANSILIEQARHFTLLVGNYSKDHFHHPGPAFLYVEAAGESLFWAWLHIVPTAWNGQLLATYFLSALFGSLAVGVGYSWARSLRGAAACFAVVTALAAVHPGVLSTDWMPYMYVPAYVAFVVAAGSVAAGRARDAWIMALAGWFLINGHVCFLLFVPVITCAVLAAVLWPRRHRLGPSARSLFVARRRVWVPVVLISVVFALPIAVNLALHWPGPFGQYLAYASSKKAGGHTMVQAVRLALWYWWPYRYAWVVPVAGYAVAIAVTRWLAPARLCGFLIALLAVNAVSSLVFLYYVLTGVGVLNEQYVGYFYWSAPLVTLLVIVLGLVEAMPARLGAAVALGTAVLALAGLAVAPQARTSTNSSDPAVLASGPDTDRALPAMVSALAARAGGRMIVLRFDQQTWPDITGFLVQAERTGVRACVANPDLDVHDDQPVHLHQRGNLGRPGVLVRPLRAPQRDHRPAQASRGHGRPGSSYWESNVVTLTSGDQVQIRTVSVSGGRLTASHLESKAQWYDPRLATANFVVLFPGVPGYSGFTNERAMLATFGRPARTYRVGSYTILIWHRNLLSELR